MHLVASSSSTYVTTHHSRVSQKLLSLGNIFDVDSGSRQKLAPNKEADRTSLGQKLLPIKLSSSCKSVSRTKMDVNLFRCCHDRKFQQIAKFHSWRVLRFQYLRRTTPQKTFFLTQRTSNEFAKSVIIISHQVISPCEGSLPPTEGLLLLTFIVVASIGWLWKSKLLKPVLSTNGRSSTHYQFN